VSMVYLPGDTGQSSAACLITVLSCPATSRPWAFHPGGSYFRRGGRSRGRSDLASAWTSLPGQDMVVGRRFVLGDGDQECEVVGVVQDIRANADQEPVAMLYLPHWDSMAPLQTVIVACGG
jgi:hypothetical protein